VEGLFSETQAVGSPHTSPCDSRSYDALRVRFSAKVGEELEIAVIAFTMVEGVYSEGRRRTDM
jgi:hypothetical protein